MKKKILLALFLALSIFSIPAQAPADSESLLNRPESPVQLFLEAEFGTVKIFHHTYRSGATADGASTFNFVTQGGQEILFPFQRFNAGVEIAGRHRVSFLYQPLEIVTEVTFREAVTIDGVIFAADTPMELTYGFPFYRLTYGYDFFPGDRVSLGAGAALQLRNASIVFKQLDGTASQMTVSQNLGPVPAIHLFGSYRFDSGLFLYGEATGLYASSAFINGADFDFEGSILDASLRAGYELKNGVAPFINLRFLGGSAAGVSQYPDQFWTESVEDATANYLATGSLTLGVSVR